MTHRKYPKRIAEGTLEVPPETSYLIEDVTELVNDRFDTFLMGAPFQIKATDFRPELISGRSIDSFVSTFRQRYLSDFPTNSEFTGLDLYFSFPLKDSKENPLNITVNWSDGKDIRLAIVDDRPILLVEESGEDGLMIHAEELSEVVMASYLKFLDLPESLWRDDIEEITRDLYNCPSLWMTRTAKTDVDLGTTLEVIHDARIAQDIDDDKQLIQELCINVDHRAFFVPDNSLPNQIHLAPHDRYRNMLRFERTNDDQAWSFAGAYHGKLGAGQLVDELVQIDPRLGIPGSKVLDKALAALSQVEPIR